jgi:hypothetical protein
VEVNDQAAAAETPTYGGLPPGTKMIWDSTASATPEAALAPSVPPPATSSVRPSVSAVAGVPAAGRGTQLDAPKVTQAMDTAYEAATTPLVDTGSDFVNRFTSPIGALALASGAGAVLRAGLGGGFAGAGWEAFQQALPQLKYEAVQQGLEMAHIPAVIAKPIALAISMYNPKGAAGAGEPRPKVYAPPSVKWPAGERRELATYICPL